MSNLKIELNLHQQKNFTTSSTQVCAKNSLIIGSVSGNNRINNEFIIDSIPDNTFSVRLLTPLNLQENKQDDYILQLHFEKI